MKNSKFSLYIISLKKNIISIIFLLFTIFLIAFSSSNLLAAKSGLKLWALNVVPSLFPFFIATNLLGYTNVIKYFSKIFNKIMRPIFNVPGEASYAFILGLISGYPVGAKIVTDLRNANLCTKDESERMLCFTNNSGPLFILGTVGLTLFANYSIGLLLLVTHILSAITVGIILGLISRLRKTQNISEIHHFNKLQKTKKICTFSNLGEVLASSIFDASKTIIMIGGFIIIFSVLLAILERSHVLEIISLPLTILFDILGIQNSFATGFVSGLIELTNGASIISSIANKNIWLNILFTAFLLGFGGFSVLLQVLSITSKADLSIKKYFYGKLLQAIIATTYTYIFLNVIPIFNLNLFWRIM